MTHLIASSDEKRPQPVNWAARITGAAALLLNGTPPLLLEFDVIEWSAAQMGAFQVWAGGVLVAAISILLGQRASHEVTPTSDPRDDSLVPLVPIADDVLED